ncbi:MAG: DJ-1/PfpI family protein [Spirochaetaceae bacterium]|jgi:4-methyl-5(b-hydroxyethyl)-thiazole monophosphate biosynthesis|nr:DJ-1/PfpI family protein [Spirochaetaceae bacterium]
MKKKVLIFLAAGFEEVEAITIIDYVRRASIDVVSVSIDDSLMVCGSHGVPVQADMRIKDIPGIDGYDALILPGGTAGSANLAAHKGVGALIQQAVEQNKFLCAICAAPVVVLGGKGCLKDHKFTCYPGMEDKLDLNGTAMGAQWSKESVVLDKKLITSRAAGTAGVFSLAIIEALAGQEEANKIAAQVLL